MKNRLKQFNKTYEEQRAAVYHTALILLKNASVAEDVLQEVFLTYYRTLERGQEVHHPRAWLLTCTRNLCYNELRDHQREQVTEDVISVALQEDPLVDIQEQDTVERVLSYLNDEEKLAFSLHYLDGYTYRQISQGLNIPIGTVQTRCRLARKKLVAVLQQMKEREEALV